MNAFLFLYILTDKGRLPAESTVVKCEGFEPKNNTFRVKYGCQL